jgi:hypothetical protein
LSFCAYAGAAPGQGAMSARLISNSPEFYRAVEVLREFDPPIMAMVMFAAMTWDAERLKQADPLVGDRVSFLISTGRDGRPCAKSVMRAAV